MKNIAEMAIERPLYPWLIMVACLFGGLYGVETVGRLEDPVFPIKNAFVITGKSETPGFMRHHWFPDVNDREAAREIAILKKEKRINSKASLEEIVAAILDQVRKKLEQEALSNVKLEAD